MCECRSANCGAVLLNYSVDTDAPAGGPGPSALKLEMTAATTQVTHCVHSQFAAPVDLSNGRAIEFTVHGDGRSVPGLSEPKYRCL